MRKVTIVYRHDPSDLRRVEMAVSRDDPPAESEWQAALRDTVQGRRVLWIKTSAQGDVWVRDREGARRARAI